jgi:hypothetical protein
MHELPGQNDATTSKAVQMPSQDQVLLKLHEAGAYGTITQSNRFYDSFATYAAGHEIVGQGLVMAWELAGYDTLSQYPPQVKAIIDMSFDRVIDAITPDPEVAQAAKDFRKKVLEEARAEAIAAEPKAEDLGLADSLDDFERFSQTREIANIVFEYASGNVKRAFDQIWMEDRRNEDANPFYDQTHRGFFLEGYYGQISKLHTPWGAYGFGGSGSGGGWDEATPKILERLGAIEVTPEHNTQMGTIGPVWAVHSVDGVALPDPVEKPRSQFTPYEEVKAAWGKLKREYATAAKASK